MGLKIAIIGTRGVPNHYGGFEHIAGYLSRGLVEKGHEVTVYNSHRHPYKQKEWHGVRIVHRFDPEYIIGMAGQFIYDLNCLLHARREKYDIVLLLGYTSSSIWSFLYPKRAVVINNMDGLEWKRSKYTDRVKRFLKYAERKAVRSCKFLVADSPVIKQYLDLKYGINTTYIPYGANIHPAGDEKVLSAFGLKKNGYFLLMARMEPENNIEMVLEGYLQSHAPVPLLVIGKTDDQYGTWIKNKYQLCKRIVFAGAIFDEHKVQSLLSCCKLYFHGHSVGGTNPSLLAAMAAKVPIAANDNLFTKNILKANAAYFNNADEVKKLIRSGNVKNSSHVENNYTSILNNYRWESVIEAYENYFIDCYIRVHGYYSEKRETIHSEKNLTHTIDHR